jgi:hypothetical protein
MLASPPVRMIKVTEQREFAPCVSVHPKMMRGDNTDEKLRGDGGVANQLS